MIEAPDITEWRPMPSTTGREDARALPRRVIMPAVVHTGMIIGMVVAMLTGLPVVSLVVALSFVVASVALAVPARHAGWAREAVVDLWAMALVLLAPMHGATGGAATDATPGLGHHSAGGFALALQPLLILTVWAGVRLLELRRSPAPRHSVVTGVVCAAQLALML